MIITVVQKWVKYCVFTRYLHYEDTLEAVESQILPSNLAHKPIDNTEHADNYLSSAKTIIILFLHLLKYLKWFAVFRADQ